MFLVRSVTTGIRIYEVIFGLVFIFCDLVLIGKILDYFRKDDE